jgi:hypothetical protein
MIVKLVMKGGGVTRTRHLRARMNLEFGQENGGSETRKIDVPKSRRHGC